MERRLLPWLAVLSCLHLLPFVMLPALIGGDEPHYALMAHSLASDLDVDLRNDYREVEAGSKAAGRTRAGQRLLPHVRDIDGRQMFAHPLGLPLIAAPLIALQALIAPDASPDLLLGSLTLLVTFAGLLAGSALAWRITKNSRDAALVVCSSYLSSPLWFYSRTFLTEPYTWSWVLLAIWSLTSGRWALASLFLALALAMKETAILLVMPILVGCATLLGMRKAIAVAIGPALFAMLFALKNILLVGTPFSTFQPFQLGNPYRGAVGLLLDPSHGLFWFAPLMIVGAGGWLLRPENDVERWLGVTSLMAFVSYFAVTAAWPDWGGAGYGPRLLLPALPSLVIPLTRILRRVRSRGTISALAILYMAGFVVNWCAVLDPLTAFWGVAPLKLVGKEPLVAALGAAVGASLLYLVVRKFPAIHPGSAPSLRPASEV
jgi:hypothetical protein